MVQSVVANRELLAAASHQSLHDPLTGLANRALFSATLALELQRSSRTGESLAVVFFDLDGFKLVNDQLGHAAGDSLLVETARRLKAGVRTSDLVARIGGDEFCAVLTACDSRADAMRVAASLCLLVAAPYPLVSGVARVSVSAGVAIGCDDDADAGELLRKADQAMYVPNAAAPESPSPGPSLSPKVTAGDPVHPGFVDCSPTLVVTDDVQRLCHRPSSLVSSCS